MTDIRIKADGGEWTQEEMRTRIIDNAEETAGLLNFAGRSRDD